MTPLRQRMLDEMKLAGLMASTQKVYVREVRRLAAYYRRCPAELSQDEVRRYLLAEHGRGVAQGTFKTCRAGLQFLYCQTLDRDWPLFTKKRSACRSKSGCNAFGLIPAPNKRSHPAFNPACNEAIRASFSIK